MKKRKKARVRADAMPSDGSSARSSATSVKVLRQGEAVRDADVKVVGGEGEGPGVDHQPGRRVDRGLGVAGPAAPQLRRPEGGRHGGAVDEVEGLGVDGRLHVERVLLARRRGAEPGADAAAHRDRAADRVAGRQLAVGGRPEHVEALDPQGRNARACRGATAGHGLGLAICRGLVEAHGGRIRAASAGPGRGTTVTFTIPAAGGSAGTAVGSAAHPRPAPEAGGPPRVLVVDDDPRTLRFVRDALSRAGYARLVIGEARDVADIIRTERPQLVLLDLLPGVDGIELLERVPELSDPPVIFISAYDRDETVARALESGAADYIVKPFSPA